MKRFAYIFVDRNMGKGYAYAYPPLAFWKSWMLKTFVIPHAGTMLKAKADHLAQKNREPKTDLENEVFEFSSKLNYTVYSLQITPDVRCPDPKAEGRNPRFMMHLVMDGAPEIISQRMNLFIEKCKKIGLETFQAGINQNLLVEMPDELYPPK